MQSSSWMLASGKGGVGKTTIASCIALGLAMVGERVAVVDTDIGLRDMDAILGLENHIIYDICNVAEKECKLTDALIQHPKYPGLSLLPAAQFRRVKDINHDDIEKIVRKLKTRFSYVIIDCSAGIERGLGNTIDVADEIIIVTTPDDMSIRDADQTVSYLMRKNQPKPWLIVNQLLPKLIKAGEMYTADTIAQILDLSLLGAVPRDDKIIRALLTHTLPMDTHGLASASIKRIVNRMRGNFTGVPPMGVETTLKSRLRWRVRR